MANYQDDKATQSSEFAVEMAIFRWGFIALVVSATAAVVLTIHTKP